MKRAHSMTAPTVAHDPMRAAIHDLVEAGHGALFCMRSIECYRCGKTGAIGEAVDGSPRIGQIFAAPCERA